MRFSTTLVAMTLLFAAPDALAGGKVEVGSKASHTFTKSPVNGMGTKSLEALRGKPVLIEFWGTR